MELTEQLDWRGRRVRWAPFAEALSAEFTTHLRTSRFDS
jgi:hypothetical protein